MKINNFRIFLAFLIVSSVLFSLVFAQPEQQQQIAYPWEKKIPESIDDLLAIQAQIQSNLPKVWNTVVSVEAEDGAGSGVIVSSDGLILTAAHVIGKSGRTMKIIFPNGDQTEALSLGGSELSDAGMLKIIEEGDWDFSPMALVNASKVGDWCFALGHPSGFNTERGTVLRVGRIILKRDETMQSDCRLLGGDSGGPLFSLNGEVIGIHSRISQSPEDNFHTPIESFISNWEYFLNEELHTLGSMQKGGFLGILCEETESGLTVLEVVTDSPAYKAGMETGDVLKQIDGIPLDTREKLTILVSSKSPGTLVVMDYVRDAKEISVRINLGDRPAVE